MLIPALSSTLMLAQEARWKELEAQVQELYQQGKYEEAVPIATEVLMEAERAFGPDDARVGASLCHLAVLYDRQGKYTEAEPLYRRALRIDEKALGPDNPDVAVDLSNLAGLYNERGKYAEAEPLLQRAVIIDEKALEPDSPGLATALGNLAGVYVDQNKYVEAEPLLQRALRIDEKALGPDNPDVATDLNNLAELYDDQGKYADAEPLFQRALHICEKARGPDDPDLATILDNLAWLYNDQRKYDEAEPLLERALRIREKALGPDDPGVATELGNLAKLYDHQTKYAAAGQLYQRALHIDEKALGPDDAVVSAALSNLGWLDREQGKYTEAELLYQRALSIDEKALGPDRPDVATDLRNLAVLHSDQGKYADAELLYRRALSIDEKALGPNHPSVAQTLNNLALLYDELGKYADAEPLYQRALNIDEKALGPDHPDVATDLGNLALLYNQQGKNADAEPLYQRALHIRENALGPNDPDVAKSLNNLGLLYDQQGKYNEAEPVLRRALGINEKALGPDHSDVAQTLNNLAELYNDEAKYSDAEPLYRRALRIDEKALGPNHVDVATILDNLAEVLQHQGKYAEAEPLLQRALSIREKALGPDHPDVGTDLNNLALLYDEEGKSADAELLYQRALSIGEKALGPEHPTNATTLENLAELDYGEGKYADAELHFQSAFGNLFQQFQYNFTYMTEKERLGFLDTVDYSFPIYFSFVHRFRSKDPSLIGSMYNLLLWEKGFIVGSVADMRRQVESSGDTEALRLLSQLTEKHSLIANLLNTKTTDREGWRKQIDQARNEANDIEKALVARSSAFADKQRLDRATWQQIRDALGPEEAAVEFASFDFFDKKWTDKHCYVALIVTRETKDEPQYIVLGEDRHLIGEALTRFRHFAQTRGLTPEADATLPGKQAYELIWKPLESALAGRTRIYISPDGDINQIPIGIIPAPGGQLLMERYDLRLLSSTKDILRATSLPYANTALLVGNPAFDLTEEQQRVALKKLDLPQPPEYLQPRALSPNTLSRDAVGAAELPRLPGTGAEVNAIAKLMQTHEWKTSVYTEDMALKSVVEQASSPRVVHLATHGFFLPDQQNDPNRLIESAKSPAGQEDPMLRSGLYFAGADRTLAGKLAPGGLDNGVLTAMEAGNLNLTGTELVVLSACNTGQGDVKNGEGVFGLRRALQESGAQAVLMSLWSVPDKETQELMESFYTKWLSGMEKHEALKQAQLEMRQQVKASHDGRDVPYYWGAFVLVGR
jgi:tetratricopeptide (TPR) repeat protein/CHAT domain-containing protein